MLDYNLPDDPRIVEGGALSGWLLVWSLCYADRHETDGFVPAVNLRREVTALGHAQPDEIIERMIRLGIFAATQRAGIGGYVVHEDYLRHQLTKAAKEQRRQQKAAAGHRGGLRSGESRRKQTRSKRQATAKHVLQGGHDAGAKQTGSTPEADAKQNEATSTSTSTSPIFSKEVLAGCIGTGDHGSRTPEHSATKATERHTRRSGGGFTSLADVASGGNVLRRIPGAAPLKAGGVQ